MRFLYLPLISPRMSKMSVIEDILINYFCILKFRKDKNTLLKITLLHFLTDYFIHFILIILTS